MSWRLYARLLFRQFQPLPYKNTVLQYLSRRSATTQAPRLRPYVTKKKKASSGYLLLIIPVTTFGLGTWQIQRREWKLGLIKELENRTTADILPLPEDISEIENLEYRKVCIKGTFIHRNELFIAPRSNIVEVEPRSAYSDSVQRIGMNVITPFKLSDRDLTIMVNRGWVPTSNKNASSRPQGQVEGEVEIVGVVRLTEPKQTFTPKNEPQKHGYWMRRDIQDMARYCGSSPVFIDVDYRSTVSGGPIGGQTRVTLRNEHMTYILTWYTLSAITGWMWYKMFRRPPPPMSAIDLLKMSKKPQ